MEASALKKYYNSVVRILSYNSVFDYENPFNKGKTNRSSGSGFFIDKQGHILTCSHCIEETTKVTINIPNEGQKEYDAEVLGFCPYFDIAMLKIKDYKVKDYLKLHNNNVKVNPGDESYAIGFPLGQENMKITKGVISGQQDNFYQTDTPINPGNSGGPLIYKGKVLGINAAGIAAMFADNIGFAVPIYRVELIADELKKPKNLISYPHEFCDYQKSNEEFKKCLKTKCNGGIIVNKIYDDSLLKKTKLEEGALLCKINGIQIDYFANMNKSWMGQRMNIENMLTNIKLGSKVNIEFWRNGKMLKDSFKLEQHRQKISEVYPNYEKVDYLVYAGIVFMNLSLNHFKHGLKTRDNTKYLEHPKNRTQNKVVITNILLESCIHKMKIFKPGDIIKSVNGKKIQTLNDVRKALKSKGDCKDFIKIQNENNEFVIIEKSKIEKNNKEIKAKYLV